MIDYSVFLKEEGLEDRVNDIRLRVTNKIPEIIVKVGKFGGEENRKELSVLASLGDYDKLVQIFAILGLTKGMLCVRKSIVYEYKGIEFALVEVPNHSFYFEAEMMISSDADKNNAKQFIKDTCKQLGLKLFTDETFFAYISKLNNEANEVFDYKNYKDGYFQDRFKL